jgi:hypothetical protein
MRWDDKLIVTEMLGNEFNKGHINAQIQNESMKSVIVTICQKKKKKKKEEKNRTDNFLKCFRLFSNILMKSWKILVTLPPWTWDSIKKRMTVYRFRFMYQTFN